MQSISNTLAQPIAGIHLGGGKMPGVVYAGVRTGYSIRKVTVLFAANYGKAFRDAEADVTYRFAARKRSYAYAGITAGFCDAGRNTEYKVTYNAHGYFGGLVIGRSLDVAKRMRFFIEVSPRYCIVVNEPYEKYIGSGYWQHTVNEKANIVVVPVNFGFNYIFAKRKKEPSEVKPQSQ